MPHHTRELREQHKQDEAGPVRSIGLNGKSYPRTRGKQDFLISIALGMLDRGDSIAEVAEGLEVSDRTIRRWRQNYRLEEGSR